MKSIALVLLLVVSASAAQDESVLPAEHPISRYAKIWENSPFNREVVAQIKAAPKNENPFSKNYVLDALVVDRKVGYIAYVKDIKNKQSLRITEEIVKTTDKTPFYIISAKKGDNPADSSITVSNGKEQADLSFAEGAFTQKASGAPASQADDQDPPADNPPLRGPQFNEDGTRKPRRPGFSTRNPEQLERMERALRQRRKVLQSRISNSQNPGGAADTPTDSGANRQQNGENAAPPSN